MARNPTYDVTFYCNITEWADFSIEGGGDLQLNVFSDFTVADFNVEASGNFINATSFNGVATLDDIIVLADFYIQYQRSNWIKWSKIGEFDFTQDRTNLAGEMPMDWTGDVWAIGRLDKILMVYGSGGITSLQPIDAVFGKATFLRLGLMSKGAVLLKDAFHLFITSDGCLWKLSDKLERLGYEEYLGDLDSPIISYDPLTHLAYICDGTDGYVFNCDTHSLGKGPANVTGIGYQDGALYALSSGIVTPLSVSIVTHPTDFSNRNFKTITEIEIGGEFEDLEVGVSFKNTSGDFTSPVWFTVTDEGRAFPNIFAKEFQFHLETDENLTLDYFNVKGLFADFNPIDA